LTPIAILAAVGSELPLVGLGEEDDPVSPHRDKSEKKRRLIIRKRNLEGVWSGIEEYAAGEARSHIATRVRVGVPSSLR
jgi:hypothetical protein